MSVVELRAHPPAGLGVGTIDVTSKWWSGFSRCRPMIPTPNPQSLDVPHPFLHWHTPEKANVQEKQSHDARAQRPTARALWLSYGAHKRRRALSKRGGMWFFSMSRARNFYLALRERVVAVVAMPVVARSSSSFCTCDRKKFTRTREPGWPQCQLLLGVGERVQFGCAAVSTFEQTRGRQIELAPVSVSRFAPPQLKR